MWEDEIDNEILVTYQGGWAWGFRTGTGGGRLASLKKGEIIGLKIKHR